MNFPIKFYNLRLIATFLVWKLSTVGLFLYFFYNNLDLQIPNLWNRWYSDKNILDAFYLPFANWDAQHYLLLADKGYSYTEHMNGTFHSQAFFPLFPLLIRALNVLISDFYISALVVNLILSYIFIFFYTNFGFILFHSNKAPVLYKESFQKNTPKHNLTSKDRFKSFLSYPQILNQAKDSHTQSSLWKGLLLSLAFPSAFFLTAFYSEALFLVLLFGFLYFYIEAESTSSHISLVMASCMLFFMPLARPHSIFILIALILFSVLRIIRGAKLNYYKEAILLISFSLGTLSYLGFINYYTGSPFTGINAQESFVAKNSYLNFFNPFHLLGYLFSPTTATFFYTDSLIDKIFIIIFLMSLVLVWRFGFTLFTLIYFSLTYMPASMGLGMSYVRFSFISFSLLSLFLIYMILPRLRTLYFYLLLIPFLFLQIYLIFRFATNQWVA